MLTHFQTVFPSKPKKKKTTTSIQLKRRVKRKKTTKRRSIPSEKNNQKFNLKITQNKRKPQKRKTARKISFPFKFVAPSYLQITCIIVISLVAFLWSTSHTTFLIIYFYLWIICLISWTFVSYWELRIEYKQLKKRLLRLQKKYRAIQKQE